MEFTFTHDMVIALDMACTYIDTHYYGVDISTFGLNRYTFSDAYESAWKKISAELKKTDDSTIDFTLNEAKVLVKCLYLYAMPISPFNTDRRPIKKLDESKYACYLLERFVKSSMS